MRCKYGATPQCKVLNWTAELELLRQIALESGLTEEIKWGVPVYTDQGRNIVTVNALKASANIGFFKGVLLKDEQKILQQQGNLQSDRLVRFTKVEDIIELEDILKSYIAEAIEIERSGKKVEFKKNPEPLPDELLEEFESDPIFKNAFYSLTPGRQRGYVIYFSQPKKSETRKSRIEKYKNWIFEGIGMHDHYKSKRK
jgi:uncharacterized protein YdeI (YjbR/CyaY-like superfamily)